MRLGGSARYLTELTEKFVLPEMVKWANENSLPIMMIGSGSNIIWKDEGFPGLIIVNKVMGFEPFQEDEENLYLTVGAGENWDSVVRRSVEFGYSGIEQLSLIPGTVGATPIQNVGAYGREISQVLVGVEVFDKTTGHFSTIPPEACEFGYRTSRFKTKDKNNLFITAISMHLSKTNPSQPFYPSLQEYLDAKGITVYTPQNIRDAVIEIRNSKLPDPARVANCGSFFMNPTIDSYKLTTLRAQNPTIPYWETSSGIKLSAAWLVENAGFKDFHDNETGMATWPKHSLVLVNEKAQSTANLIKFRDKILTTVKQKFQVDLVQEPELLP